MTVEPHTGLEGALGNNTKTLLAFSSLLNKGTSTVSAAVPHLQLLKQPGHTGKPGQVLSLSVNTNEYDKNIFV